MTETIKEMRTRHEQEITELQKNCQHPQISGWMPYMWAPGHYFGDVKVCEICGKIMERGTPPNTGTITTDTDWWIAV